MRLSKKIGSSLIIALISLMMIASNVRVAVAWPSILIDARTSWWSFYGNYAGAISILETNGYAVDLFTTGTITLGLLQQYCAFVIVTGDQGYSASEISDILAYVDGGGGLLFLGEWGGGFTHPSAESIALTLGVTINHDEIIDPTDNWINNFWPRITTFPTPHPVTSGITEFILGASATLDITSPAVTIATGDGDTYTTTTPSPEATPLEDPGATPPPQEGGSYEPVLAVSTYGGGRAVIFGDSDVFDSSTSFNGIVLADNADLWLNIFLWICGPGGGVIPEYPIGTIVGAIAMFAALLSFGVVRKRKWINGNL